MLMKLKFIFIKAVINYRGKKGGKGGEKGKIRRKEMNFHGMFCSLEPIHNLSRFNEWVVN